MRERQLAAAAEKNRKSVELAEQQYKAGYSSTLSEMVGAMVLARAVDDDKLAAEILDASFLSLNDPQT